MRRKNIAALLLMMAATTGCAQTNIETDTNIATQSEINTKEDSDMGLGKLFSSIFDSKKESGKDNAIENSETNSSEEQITIFGEKEEEQMYEYDTPILPSDAPEAKVNGQDVPETASSVPTNLPDNPDAAWEMQNHTESE